MIQQRVRGGGEFQERPRGREIPRQHRQCSGGADRRAQRLDNLAIVALRRLQVLPQHFPGNRQAFQLEKAGDFLRYRRESPSTMEVLHKIIAGRLEVNDHGGGTGQFIEEAQRQTDAEPSGDGHQVNDRVGRAPNGA